MNMESVARQWNLVKTDFRNNWIDYAKPAVCLTLTTGIVRVIWGKYAAIGFGTLAIVAFPFIKKPICIIFHYDLNAVVLSGMATVAAALCFINPFLACTMMGGVAIAILRRDWTISAIAHQNQQEIEILRRDNESLKQTCNEIKQHIGNLESVFKTCLGISEKVVQAPALANAALATLGNLDKNLESELIQVGEKLKKLTSLCQLALSGKDLIARMETARQVESELSQLSSEYTARKAELKIINEELRAARSQLSAIVSSLSGLEDKQHARLSELSRLLIDMKA